MGGCGTSLYQLELESRGGVRGTREIDKITKEEWRCEIRSCSCKRTIGNVTLKRARFDLNGDGVEDWVLAYGQDSIGCNNWNRFTHRGLLVFVRFER